MIPMKSPVQRYRGEAEECQLNAEKTQNLVDKQAWQRLADDWAKLAGAAELVSPNDRQGRATQK
jgi:predicted ATPase